MRPIRRHFLLEAVAMKRVVLGLFLTGLFLFLPPFSWAKATREILVGGGTVNALPIQILPFTGEGENGDLPDLSGIVQRDLVNSGQFRVSEAGSENLVQGRIQKTSGRYYQVYFELLDGAKSGYSLNKKPLLAMQFNAIHADAFRALAHHISDLIFERLLGVKGVFSTRIAYITVKDAGKQGREYALEVSDMDGYRPRVVKKNQFPLMSPAWSPDGKRIAFVSFENNRAAIYITTLASSKTEKVSQFPGINGAPAWSPDGRQLALVLSKEGCPKIYTLDLETKQLRRVTEGASIDTEPCWSPQGDAILFTSNRGGKPQIYKLVLATGRVERLTFQGNYNAKPSLTRDGKYLVMIHQGEEGRFSIAAQTMSTGQVKILTQTTLSDSPSLAPNGRMVLYGTEEAGRGVLCAVSLDGKVKVRLPEREGDMQSPTWSPYVASQGSMP